MKTCNKCSQELALDQFPRNSTRKDGRGYTCRLCMKQQSRASYQANKQVYVERALAYKRELAVWFLDVKSQRKCEMCGESKPWRLSFHHKDPSQKDSAVSLMITNHCSKEAILKEISKCMVVCHNCHSDIHHAGDTNRSMV